MKRPGVPLEAIEAMYRTRAADFFRFALAKTGDRDRARDAVQEGFARAIRGRATFRGAGQLDAWVARCVLNAAHDPLVRSHESPSRPQWLPRPRTGGSSVLIMAFIL